MKKIFLILFTLIVFCSCTRSLPSAYTARGKDYKRKVYIRTELNDCKMHNHPVTHQKAIKK